MKLAYPVVRGVDQAETPHTFAELLAISDILDVRVGSQVGLKRSALVAFFVVESVRTWAAAEMSILHIIGLDLLQDV